MRCFYTTPPPSIPPEQLASGSRRVSRQSCLSVDPAQYPARASRQWIPPSIPPERLASGSRQVSCQRLASGSRRVSRESGSPGDAAEYPARVAGSRRASHQSSPPIDPAKYPAEYPLPVDLASIEPKRIASTRQWIPPVSRQSCSPVWFCLMSRPAHSWVYISSWCLRVLSVP